MTQNETIKMNPLPHFLSGLTIIIFVAINLVNGINIISKKARTVDVAGFFDMPLSTY